MRRASVFNDFASVGQGVKHLNYWEGMCVFCSFLISVVGGKTPALQGQKYIIFSETVIPSNYGKQIILI